MSALAANLPQTVAGQGFPVLRPFGEIRGMPLIWVWSACATLVPAHRKPAYTDAVRRERAPLLCNTGYATYSAIMAIEAALERLVLDQAPTCRRRKTVGL
ncbi:hypothetical protein EM868_02215 [Cupriavidus gilardii]|nr:hypothetical protein [Cupriavidus gilardii]